MNTTPSTTANGTWKRALAVVCQRGRPELADDATERMRATALLIVGGNDRETLRLNSEAAEHLQVPHKLRERTWPIGSARGRPCL